MHCHIWCYGNDCDLLTLHLESLELKRTSIMTETDMLVESRLGYCVDISIARYQVSAYIQRSDIHITLLRSHIGKDLNVNFHVCL